MSDSEHRAVLRRPRKVGGVYRCEYCERRANTDRPYSVHVDQDNYLYLKQIDFFKPNTRLPAENRKRISRPRTCHFEPAEHIYEEVKKESQMRTLDIRIYQSKEDIKRESAAFSDDKNDPKLGSDCLEKPDCDLEFLDDKDKLEERKAAAVTRVNILRRNILTRIRSLVRT